MTATVTAPPEAIAPSARPMRPLRSRYLLSALLLIIPLAAVLLWEGAAQSAVDWRAESFDRGNVPGVVMVDGHPGTWSIYAEGDTTVTGVRVTDATGAAIPVTMTTPTDAPYVYVGSGAKRVATFHVQPSMTPAQTWRVTAEGSGRTFAVGEEDLAGFMRAQHWGMAALLLVTVASSVLIVVVPIVRARRHALR